MSKSNTTLYLMLAGGAAVAYFMFGTTTPGTVTANLATNSAGAAIDAAGTLPQDIVGGVSNYSTQVKNHPDLLNPNYQLTPAQCAQYLANYLDLRQGLPAWVGNMPGVSTINQACQLHWTDYGPAAQYTYYQLIPTSTRPFVPAPVAANNSSGSGSGWLGSALSVATAVLPLI